MNKKFISFMVVFNVLFLMLLAGTCSAEGEYTQEEVTYLTATSGINKAHGSTVQKFLNAERDLSNETITQSEYCNIMTECIVEEDNYMFALNDRLVTYRFNELHCKQYMLISETQLEMKLCYNARVLNTVESVNKATAQVKKVNKMMDELTQYMKTL